jgi:putative isomerase
VMEEKSLAAMATALGLPGEATAWESAAAARAARINATMWDDATGFYYDVSLATHDFTVHTHDDLQRLEIAGFLPLWAGIVPAARRPALLAKLADPSLFLRAYGVAGLSARDPFYAPAASACCRWNGPVVVPWQWLVVRGLRAGGDTALANEITSRTLAAVRAELSRSHQFRELYDPDDAAPANASTPNHVWGAMAALMVLEGP